MEPNWLEELTAVCQTTVRNYFVDDRELQGFLAWLVDCKFEQKNWKVETPDGRWIKNIKNAVNDYRGAGNIGVRLTKLRSGKMDCDVSEALRLIGQMVSSLEPELAGLEGGGEMTRQLVVQVPTGEQVLFLFCFASKYSSVLVTPPFTGGKEKRSADSSRDPRNQPTSEAVKQHRHAKKEAARAAEEAAKAAGEAAQAADEATKAASGQDADGEQQASADPVAEVANKALLIEEELVTITREMMAPRTLDDRKKWLSEQLPAKYQKVLTAVNVFVGLSSNFVLHVPDPIHCVQLHEIKQGHGPLVNAVIDYRVAVNQLEGDNARRKRKLEDIAARATVFDSGISEEEAAFEENICTRRLKFKQEQDREAAAVNTGMDHLHAAVTTSQAALQEIRDQLMA